MSDSITSYTHVLRARLDEIGLGDPEFTIELIDIMLEDGTQRVRNLRAAYEAQHNEEIGKIAHSLKGASLNVGAVMLAELCAEIDDLVRRLKSKLEEERVRAIEEEFTHVQEELAAIKKELCT